MKNKKKFFARISLLYMLTVGTIALINEAIDNLSTGPAVTRKQDKYYNWRLGKIHYTVEGSGSPLLLIHDAYPWCSIVEWKMLCGNLAKNHTVYCIDLPGCGLSERPKMLYTNFVFVRLLSDFIRSVIGQKTDVITSGLSGSFAIMAARNDKETIDRIIMINPTDLAQLSQTPTRLSSLTRHLFEIPLFGRLLYYIMVSAGNIELLFTEKYLYNPFRRERSLQKIFYENAHRSKGNGRFLYASITGKYIYANIAPVLKTLDQPVTILFGYAEESRRETAALYTSIQPDIQCEVCPRAKHFPHLENPEQTAEILSLLLE